MKRIKSIAVLLGLTFAAGGVLAHDDAYLDTQKAPNGGQLRMAGPNHYELVVVRDSKEAKENAVVVFVTDHAGQKVLTVGASGTATILAGKLKATSSLKPDGDNRMKGFAKYASTSDMKVVVSITLSGKPAEQARFTPLGSQVQAHAAH
ncbi:MAG: hypothetical protein KIT42_08785 [Rhodocyclaceae bacterium]|jgi:hypothetical protein|nr:hypothetical protein [Rhodocyclaceae bacterium]MCB1891375.1 hypothetical protein [Rhodocyclaceae bacterium]MCP5297309.1 hypothetical protein [Zoogloeaceae bacterium]MCW5595950.1 hypothetical protein [Rhodocyclaceae bacterium]